jgi:hypothetical protein
MPPISSRETIPNFPLNGQELAIYARNTLAKVCEQRGWESGRVETLVGALQRSLENDWVFKQQFIYANVSFEIAVESHAAEENTSARFAFSIAPVFHFPNNASYPESKPFVHRPVGISSPPLEDFGADAIHFVDCFTVSVKVENPNLVRVHCGLPITIAEKVQPKHGELFGTITNHEVRYDPSDYEPLPPFLVIDNSLEFSGRWNLPPGMILYPAEQQIYTETSDGTPAEPVSTPPKAQKRDMSDFQGSVDPQHPTATQESQESRASANLENLPRKERKR